MGETSYLVNNAQFTEGNGALGLRVGPIMLLSSATAAMNMENSNHIINIIPPDSDDSVNMVSSRLRESKHGARLGMLRQLRAASSICTSSSNAA
ncbi:hypothetical protein F444_14025 [Phytophthora nicotianae P1976]|uniref:Uncharacterized protein n=1 Tax=Phytophthora nicotianae P1976 TaxID=1317066 RepID=A0A080ZRX0_PHYNI|nr:hypothetical protein F444_14025 [Phytophthora nicotianae P1976]